MIVGLNEVIVLDVCDYWEDMCGQWLFWLKWNQIP